MFGIPDGLLNRRQGFGPIGDMPTDPRSEMLRTRQGVGLQTPQPQPAQTPQQPNPALAPGTTTTMQATPVTRPQPQYSGFNKFLDVLGTRTRLGRGIEEATGLGTLGAKQNLFGPR